MLAASSQCSLRNETIYTFLAHGGAPPAHVPSQGGGGGDVENFDPPCSLGPTVAGLEIKKGTKCVAEDPQLCWRSCGPGATGWKSETCTSGIYVEGDCEFPSAIDYSCYSIPATIDMNACPSAIPKGGDECDVALCTLCNVDGTYFDSSNNVKTGYCVCGELRFEETPAAGGAAGTGTAGGGGTTGGGAAGAGGVAGAGTAGAGTAGAAGVPGVWVRRWTCASGTAWPCPQGRGC
jgi:hypothetical protein